MDDIAHLIYLDEIKDGSTVPNAFLKVRKHIDPNGYMWVHVTSHACRSSAHEKIHI
jgi:hypothetical protein